MTAPSVMGAREVVRRIRRISPAPRGRLLLAAALGIAATGAVVGLFTGSGYVLDRAAFRPGLGAIAGVLAAVEVLAFSRAPLRYAERLVSHDAAMRSLGRWRLWLYDALEARSPAALRAWRSGDVLARAVDDVDTLQGLYLRGLLPVVLAVTSSVISVTVVGVLVPPAALVLAASLLVALVGAPLLALLAHSQAERSTALLRRLSAEVVDLVQGAPDLLAFGAEIAALERVAAIERERARLSQAGARRAGAAPALIVACLGAGVVGTLALSVHALAHHHLEPVMLSVVPLAVIATFEPLPALAQAALHFGDVIDAGRRILELGDVPVPVIDPERPVEFPAGAAPLSLDDVALRYRPDGPWALDGVSFDVAPGGRVGIVGPSGAGKSSIVNLLLRFWPAQRGEISFGDVSLDDLAQRDVRRHIALLDQDATLFAGSIRDNLLLARPGAATEDLSRVVRLGRLDEWVATLPKGLDTPVGEGGIQVSGGQRQRIGLARALLADAPLLVLDEPTAGLDEPTADALMADVLATRGERSMLVVSHRDGDLVGLDEVVVVDGGRVIGRTTREGDAR